MSELEDHRDQLERLDLITLELKKEQSAMAAHFDELATIIEAQQLKITQLERLIAITAACFPEYPASGTFQMRLITEYLTGLDFEEEFRNGLED